jgi:hypothetical protein
VLPHGLSFVSLFISVPIEPYAWMGRARWKHAGANSRSVCQYVRGMCSSREHALLLSSHAPPQRFLLDPLRWLDGKIYSGSCDLVCEGRGIEAYIRLHGTSRARFKKKMKLVSIQLKCCGLRQCSRAHDLPPLTDWYARVKAAINEWYCVAHDVLLLYICSECTLYAK